MSFSYSECTGCVLCIKVIALVIAKLMSQNMVYGIVMVLCLVNYKT